MRRFACSLAAAAAFVLSMPGGVAPARPSIPFVREIAQTGTVDPLEARYVKRGIAGAQRDGAAAVLLRIDTPGGLDSSMRTIVQAILAARVPVVCWVGPPGARAASAGTFILLACPVASMAPGTNVGAAHPVGFSGEVLGEKITNDAAAFIRSLAQRWNRNADWAEKAVRESVSVSAEDALRLHVVDRVAADRRSLLEGLNGTTVRTSAGDVVLATGSAAIEPVPMTASEAVLHTFVDPNLAFLFFVFGIAGIVFEVLHPGISVPGVAGVLMLISALVILGMLPVNVGGLLLIVAAIAFFVVDAHVAGHGLPTVAGVASLVLGGLFLFDAAVPNARVSKPLIAGVAVSAAAMFFFVVRAILTARRAPSTGGAASLTGAEGVVVRSLDPAGIVHVKSEQWTAESAAGPIPEGTRVRVTGMRGLVVVVEPLKETGRTVRPEGTEVS